MKRIVSGLLVAILLISGAAVFPHRTAATPEDGEMPFEVAAKSALLMDYSTGTVLFEQNADTPLPPASVTKVMTLLLIMEAVDGGRLSLDDKIPVSERAASMGGSQVYLEPGENVCAEDLLKSIVIASANDAALAMAETVAGSEEAFVAKMNERAAELGMKNTNFENVTGLDDSTENHVTSARDIALMSRELMSHEKIFEFSSLWRDSIRDGAFGLTNTNRLVRFYNGATGLKTGSTSKAGFCISATAKRDGLHLIAVIMGAETRDVRNEAAKSLLDWGFANYAIYSNAAGETQGIPVRGGTVRSVTGGYPAAQLLLTRGQEKNVTVEYLSDEFIAAPVVSGDRIGTVRYACDGKVLREDAITAQSDVPEIGFAGLLLKMIGGYLLK